MAKKIQKKKKISIVDKLKPLQDSYMESWRQINFLLDQYVAKKKL
jgi:hypothetical protein